jgi:hypothetical protein
MERPGGTQAPPDPQESGTGSFQQLPSYVRLQIVDPREYPGTVELNPISPPTLREVAHLADFHYPRPPPPRGHLYAADGRVTAPQLGDTHWDIHDHVGPEGNQRPSTSTGPLFATSMAPVPRLGQLVPARWSQEEIEAEFGVTGHSSTESEYSLEDDSSIELPNHEVEWEQNNTQETAQLGPVSTSSSDVPQNRMIEIPSGVCPN